MKFLLRNVSIRFPSVVFEKTSKLTFRIINFEEYSNFANSRNFMKLFQQYQSKRFYGNRIYPPQSPGSTKSELFRHFRSLVGFILFASIIWKIYNYFHRIKIQKQVKEDDKYPEYVPPKTLEEKRSQYITSLRNRYLLVSEIPKWREYSKIHEVEESSDHFPLIQPNEEINSKISLFRGDIRRLEIDGIMNAANHTLGRPHGGGIDEAIHIAADTIFLRRECYILYNNQCSIGDCKISRGFKLPAKYVLHTVAPGRSMGEDSAGLRNCYISSFREIENNGLKTVAFCCLGTGVNGFDKEFGCKIALEVTRLWLEKNHELVERIIFCVRSERDRVIYENLIPYYFPKEKE